MNSTFNDKPPEPEDDADAPDVQRRFEETLGNLLRTPHKPHTGGEKLKKGREPKPAPHKK